MDLFSYHELMADSLRLRIVNLLIEGPLCVCHFQELLNQPQVKISKHLGILRRKGLLTAKREGYWMIYELPEEKNGWLRKNLKALKRSRSSESVLEEDLARRERLMISLSRGQSGKVPAEVCSGS